MTEKDQKKLAEQFKKLLKPYQVEPGGWGLDREDHNKLIGMENAIEAVALAFGLGDEWLKEAGHSMMDLGYLELE